MISSSSSSSSSCWQKEIDEKNHAPSLHFQISFFSIRLKNKPKNRTAEVSGEFCCLFIMVGLWSKRWNLNIERLSLVTVRKRGQKSAERTNMEELSFKCAYVTDVYITSAVMNMCLYQTFMTETSTGVHFKGTTLR